MYLYNIQQSYIDIKIIYGRWFMVKLLILILNKCQIYVKDKALHTFWYFNPVSNN